MRCEVPYTCPARQVDCLSGKDAVVNHHQSVPYRLLRDVPGLGGGDTGTGASANLPGFSSGSPG